MTEIIANSCKICGQPTIHACEECQQDYCSGCELQDHWEKCRTYKVCVDEFGFFLTSIRNLYPGEVIFSELPLVVGSCTPRNQDKVPCVACFRLVQNYVNCPQCLWPLCELQCESIGLKHELECQVLSQHQEIFLDSKTKSYRFDFLLALKTFLLQTTSKKEWNKLLNRLLKASSCFGNLDLSINLLEQLSCFLEENTCHISDIQVFYSTASILEHSCLPNTSQTIATNGYKTEIRALERINKNTRLSLSYTNLLHGTHARLEDLRKKKNRTCACDRCTDPTEFGTFFSALKCMEPCGGIQLPINPLNPKTSWLCDKCHIELFNDHVVKFVHHLGEQTAKFLATKYTRQDLEQFLQKLLIFLHPNHYHVFAIKRALVQMDGGQSQSDELKEIVQMLKIKSKLF